MPLFYWLAEACFADGAADFSGPGSPLAELLWGMAMWALFVATALGVRQGPVIALARPRRSSAVIDERSRGLIGQLLSSGAVTSVALGTTTASLPSSPRRADAAPARAPGAEDEVVLLCAAQQRPSARQIFAAVERAMRRTATVVAIGSAVCTFIAAVTAHVAAIDAKGWALCKGCH